MSDKLIAFLWKVLALAVIIGLGALVSWIFYYLKRRDLFGGFIGGMVVGVIGALIGALIMASLDNGMSMLGVETYWQMIVKGSILLLAVWIDVVSGAGER